MKGICLKFYAYENQKHKGMLIYEWLLHAGKKQKLEGGTATRTIAGYGRHHVFHEQQFFELSSDVPVEISFITSEEGASQFIETLRSENLDLFYTKSMIEFDHL